MKCLACDRLLSDFESTRKYNETQEFVDLCNSCLSTIPNMPPTMERAELWEALEIDVEPEFIEYMEE